MMDELAELELRRRAAAGDERAELELLRQTSSVTADAPVVDPGQAYLGELAQQQGPIDAALIGAGRSFTQLGRGIGNLVGMGYEPNPTEEMAYQALQKERPIATAVGESAPYMAGAGVTGAVLRGAGVAGALPHVAAQAGTGATLGGATYAPDAEGRLVNAATEGALGAGGEVVGRVAGRVLAPRLKPRADAPLADRAERLGYEVLPSTRAEGFQHARQTIEGGMEAMPGSGGLFNKKLRANQRVFNSHAAAAIGEQSDAVTGPVYKAAKERIGREFNRLTSSDRVVPIGIDDPMVDAVVEIADKRIFPMIARGTDPIGRATDRALEVLERGVRSGGLSARELFEQQSMLRKLGQRALSGQNPDPEVGHAMLDLQDIFLDAARRGLSPEDAAAFDLARKQYRNLMTIKQGGFDPVTGDVSPKKVANFLQRRDEHGFTMETNRSPFYEGARFLGRLQPRLQSSGTAERMFLQNALMGAIAGGVPGAVVDDQNRASGGATGAVAGAAATIAAPWAMGRTYLGQPLRTWMHHQISPATQAILGAGGQSAVRQDY
jgi:hypothetical protein